MKSKFRIAAYLLTFVCVLLSLILAKGFIEKVFSSNLSFGTIFLECIFFACVWIWIVFGELRTKVISVKIDNRTFIVKGFLGLGKSKVFELDDICGFKTSILSAKGGSYEYLYLMVGNRKVAKLSMFYHSNYKELKRYIISMNIKNIGFEPFSNRQELRDIFSS